MLMFKVLQHWLNDMDTLEFASFGAFDVARFGCDSEYGRTQASNG
jgi:hypothetical protein